MGNIGDPSYVKQEQIKVKNERKRELDDLRAILDLQGGRRFIWRLMERCRTFESIWEPSAKIHFNAGMQDLGHFIMAEITEANKKKFFQMMEENQQGEDNE